MWTFFYGSYINFDVLKGVDLVPESWEVARLGGFDIRIEPRANLVRSDADMVYGIAATATHEELTRLYAHAKDVLGALYLPEPVLVEHSYRQGSDGPLLHLPQRGITSSGRLGLCGADPRPCPGEWISQRYLDRLAKFLPGPAPALDRMPPRLGVAAARYGCGALCGDWSGHNVGVMDASPMLVGRASEEREIEARLSLAERGVGGLVVLVGEPGLGKTALAEHASVAARQRGFSVGWAACWQTAAVPPLQPWTELVGQLARPGVTSPDLAIPGGDRHSGRVEQAARVVEWLRERADAPLLLVVDDLHWADAATLSVLTQVASVLASMSIVVVAAHRPVDAAGALPRWESIAELQHHGLVLELRGLDVDGTTALVSAVRPGWPI